MENKVRVILAKEYNLVVGDTFQLYYRSIIESPNPYGYSILAVCEKGKNFPRYFELTPEEEGEYKLTISLYDSALNVVGSGETILKVSAPKEPSKPVNVLCLGDSLTANGKWVNEVNRRICHNGGVPAGHGFKNVNFIGTCKKLDPAVGSEGYGGWQWSSFLNAKEGDMWVRCANNRSDQDQHSIWEDENGALWQLETIQIDYLKFTRFKDHTSPRPLKGVLKHYKNALDTSPIVFDLTSAGTATPFLNPETKKIDFDYYLKINNVDKIDYIYILLGTNGLMRDVALKLPRYEFCKIVVQEAKELVDAMKKAWPNVKIKVMAEQLPSCRGGMGSNYGASLPFCHYYEIAHYLFELNLAYQEWALEDGYKDFMEFINLTSQFDSEYGYPHIFKPVNTRSSEVEWFDTNGFHPSTSGCMQIADAVYRNLIATLKK